MEMKEGLEYRTLYQQNMAVYIKLEYFQSLYRIISTFWLLMRSVVNLNFSLSTTFQRPQNFGLTVL